MFDLIPPTQLCSSVWISVVYFLFVLKRYGRAGHTLYIYYPLGLVCLNRGGFNFHLVNLHGVYLLSGFDFPFLSPISLSIVFFFFLFSFSLFSGGFFISHHLPSSNRFGGN